MKNFSKNNHSKKIVIKILEDQNQKIIINLMILVKIDITQVKIILLKEMNQKKEMNLKLTNIVI